MNVRECTLDDLDWLTSKAIEFNNRYYSIPVDEGRLRNYLTNMINLHTALRTDEGAIIGIVVDDPIRDWTVHVELGWYSTGRDGLRLLEAFEEVGKELGVDETRMSVLSTSRKSTRALLERRGYKVAEVSLGLNHHM